MRKFFTFLLALAASVGMSWAAPAVAIGGKLPGKFSVSATKKVYFSQGNLQYNSNNQRWQFAENQYSYIGNAAGNNAITASGIANNSGVVDLFYWVGASSSWTGLKQYGITIQIPAGANPAVDGCGTTAGEALKSDWGKLAIYNGGNTANSGWFTLSWDEWYYLMYSRNNASNLYTNATVNGVKGLIIMPDGWTANGVSLYITPSFTANNINSTQWATLEGQGCVFLPAAGYRSSLISPSIFNAGDRGKYWTSSSSTNNAQQARSLVFSQQSITLGGFSRFEGLSVRLVSTTPPVITVTNPTITLSQSSYTYNGTARTPSVTVKNGNTTIPSSEYTVSYSNNVNAGTATVTITDKAGGNYNVSGSKTFTINKANCTFTTTPSAKSGLTYNGSAQNLINAGAANAGTVQYKLGNGSWGTAIPKATDAGSYTVYYRIVAPNNNYNGNSGSSFQVTIAKANPTVTAPTAKANLTYSGSAQALVNAGSTNGGTMKYSLDNSTWNTSVPTGTNAGSYTVYYKVEGNTNYNGNNGSNFQVTIAKSSTTTIATVPAAIENLEYTGDAQPLATAGSSPDGTMMYSLDGTNWSEDIPTGTAVGVYTVYYYVKGDANHNDGAVQSFNVSIAEKASAAMGDSGDNTVVGAAISSFLAAQDGHTIDQVAIVRPVYRNTYYNTLCLPFDLPTLTGTILEGFKVMELSGISVNGGTLNVELEEATSIVAGKPYFVKYEAETDVLSQLDFTDVTINNADLIDNAVTIDGVTFRGTFAPYAMEAQTEESHSYLFLGQNNVLYWPNANGNLLSFRAFFVINTGANNSPIRRGMPARIVENHQTTTDFENVQNNVRSEKVMENGVLYIIKNGVKYNAQGQIVK